MYINQGNPHQLMHNHRITEMHSKSFLLISAIIWGANGDFQIPKVTPKDICKTDRFDLACWNPEVEIQLITKDLLKICNDLNEVHITGCDIEDGAFTETPKVTVFYLAHMNYTSETVSAKTFEGLGDAKEVWLINPEKSVKKYEDLCFSPFKSVEKMLLYDFSVPSLSPNTLKGLDNLKDLHLNKFNLKSIVWHPMPKLVKLRLDGYNDYADFDVLDFFKQIPTNFPNLKDIWLYEDKVPKEIRDILDGEAKKLNLKITWEEKYPTRIEF